MRLLAAAVAMLALHGAARADDHALDPAAARARIAHERDAAQRRYTQTVRECQTKFIVTRCVDDAKAARREQLQRLDSEQAVLDEAERRRRAAEQLQRIADKERAAAQRAASAPSPRVVQRDPVLPRAASAPLLPRGALPQSDALSAAEREANRRAYEQRQREAAAHRAEVEKRNAVGGESKPALPVPSAASAASVR